MVLWSGGVVHERALLTDGLVEERQLPKLNVVGSSPISRSI